MSVCVLLTEIRVVSITQRQQMCLTFADRWFTIMEVLKNILFSFVSILYEFRHFAYCDILIYKCYSQTIRIAHSWINKICVTYIRIDLIINLRLIRSMYIKTCSHFYMSEIILLSTWGKQHNLFIQFLETSARITFKQNCSSLPYHRHITACLIECSVKTVS